MSHFLVTFRVEYDSTYQDRYQSLVDRVRQIATSVVWEETTSVLVFQASGTAETVCDDLYFTSKLSGLADHLCVFELLSGRYATRGLKDFATLKSALGA